LIDCLANYNAYNSEARVVSKAVSRVWIIVYLIGCKRFSIVIDHATFTHVFKQPVDKPTYQQSHCIEPLMPCAQCTSILYY
jgi:hypothetical protein